MKMNYEPRTAEFEGQLAYNGRDSEAPKRRVWLMVAAVAVLLAVLVGAYFKMRAPTGDTAKPAAAKDDKQAANVTVVVPGRQLVENVVTATGTLAARRELPVGAVGEGGLVVRVLADAGSWVKAGQVLAVVDRQVQAQQSNQIVAQISAAEAEARLAQSELERSRALQSRGFVSKADLQRKAATRDGALARVRIAQAQYAENRARMGRLDIRAPASGLVLSRMVEPGQVVGAGAGVLFRIALGGEMEMKAKLSESDLVRMREGLSAEVTPVGSAQSFWGRIWQVAPVIDPQSRQGEARIALSYNQALRPGGFASARISSGAIEAPLLAESAVQSDPKGNYVYIVTPDNKVERRDVTVGTIGDQGVSIVEGLSGTEKVVYSAGGFLNPGDTVVPTRLAPAK
jgi:HlyD family secretion protein